MSRRKKIVLISVLSLVALFLLFIGYHYILYLKTTSRMEELSADLEKRITEWEQKEYKRSPLFGPTIPGNAAEFYQEADEKIDMSDDGWMGASDAIYTPSQAISPKGKVYYEHNKPLIEIVRKGTRAETYKSMVNFRDGFKAKTPHLLNPRIIANLMVLQSRELNNAGQTSEAIKELCDIIQFGDDYLHHGSLVAAMIGLGVSDIGHEEIHRLIASDKLTETQLSELQFYFKALIDSNPTMQDAWEGDILGTSFALKDMAEESGVIFGGETMMPVYSMNESWWGKTIKSLRMRLINRSDFVEAWDDYITFVEGIKRMNSLPYPQAKEEWDKSDSKINQLNNQVSRIMLLHLRSINNSCLHATTIRKGLYILTALQLYKIKHGAYPETLSALAPEIIPEVPLDPFSEKPFVYRLDKDNKLMLYSVWYNLKDDNGEKHGNRYEDLLITPTLRYGEKE